MVGVNIALVLGRIPFVYRIDPIQVAYLLQRLDVHCLHSYGLQNIPGPGGLTRICSDKAGIKRSDSKHKESQGERGWPGPQRQVL